MMWCLWTRDLWRLVQWCAQTLGGACRHPHLPLAEGKAYCAHCGQGVIARWTVLRCQGCHTRRPAQYWLNTLTPKERYCHQCGETAYQLTRLEQPAFYQLEHALLILATESDPRGEPLRRGWVHAWLESPWISPPAPPLRGLLSSGPKAHYHTAPSL